MKKTFVRAIGIGLLFVFVYYAFRIVQGIYLTTNHVPDVLETYNTVEYMQQEVAFGYVISPVWTTIEVLGLLLLGCFVYYAGRKWRRKR
jgi:menaquinol-cytochrome c reductase cytochrome b subunit